MSVWARARAVLLVMAMVAGNLPASTVGAASLGQAKGPPGRAAQSAVQVASDNGIVKVAVSSGGRFTLGTTGGEPNVPGDDNKRLLYGYPSDVGSSFTSVRITSNGTSTDYRLGNTSWNTGQQPSSGPSQFQDGTIQTVYTIAGVAITETLDVNTINPVSGRKDGALITYSVRNTTTAPVSVGIRMMLDVDVGGNDGAPYFIEGTGQVTREFEFLGAAVPSYWIAHESPTFDTSLLQARGQMTGQLVTTPDRFVIARWPTAFNSMWDYTVDSTSNVTSDSATLLYWNPRAVQGGASYNVSTFYGIGRAGQANLATLELTGLEVTQAIQDLKNSVPLIQDRPTVVRAHVRSTLGTIDNVVGELVGTRGGVALPGSPLRPSNVGGRISVRQFPNRVSLDDSFYYDLPASWRSGTIDLEFRGVDRTFVCKEAANTPNDCKARITFIQSPAMDIRFVGYTWSNAGTTHTPTSADIQRAARQLESLYPIPRVTMGSSATSPLIISPSFLANHIPTFDDFASINTNLRVLRLLEGCWDFFIFRCRTYYIGVLADTGGGALGMAEAIPGEVGSGFITARFTIPHEIGHDIGRRHVRCTGTEAGTDASYPFANGLISATTSGDDAYYGFDTNTRVIYSPTSGDLMSYCTTRWPSSYTYNAIRGTLATRYSAALAAQSASTIEPAQASPTGPNVVIVSGIIPASGPGQIQSVYHTTAAQAPSAPPTGSYAIQFLNSAGQEIARYAFEPETPSEGTNRTFALALPWDPATVRMVIVGATGQEVVARAASANPPVVTVTSPNGGETLSGATATITWSASDPDGDALRFAVQYSPDNGATWQSLASDLTATSYTVDLTALRGSNRALIRVLANDGFLTSQDQSDAVFTVAGHPPVAQILRPETNSAYTGGQTIVLEGRGTDIEDGDMADAALTWSSNVGGTLGTGRSFSVDASTLAEGSHTITLTARDSDGQTGAAAITIQVSRTRQALAAALSVSPQVLSFTAGPTTPRAAGQPVAIRNTGDGTLSWGATADQPWVQLSSASGTAPTDILIAADATGLSVGSHTATVTISAAGASNSPQLIDVTLNVFPAASMTVSPTSLTFTATLGGTQTAEQTLEIRNPGEGTVTWSAAASQPWIKLSTASGTAPTDLKVSADPTGLPIGSYTGTITIQAAGGATTTQTVNVTLTVTAAATLEATPETLTFTVNGGALTSTGQTLQIRNTGGGTLTWTATATQPWIKLSSNGGTAPTDVTVTADPRGLGSGNYTGEITITAAGAIGSPKTVRVTLTVGRFYTFVPVSPVNASPNSR